MTSRSTQNPASLDERLSAAFRGLDTTLDFEARLLARIRAQSQDDAAEQAGRARLLEQQRYGAARLELSSWRHWTQLAGRVVSPERAGVAALLIGAAVTLVPWELLRPNVPALFTVLAVFVALVPVAVTLARQYRGRIGPVWGF